MGKTLSLYRGKQITKIQIKGSTKLIHFSHMIYNFVRVVQNVLIFFSITDHVRDLILCGGLYHKLAYIHTISSSVIVSISQAGVGTA